MSLLWRFDRVFKGLCAEETAIICCIRLDFSSGQLFRSSISEKRTFETIPGTREGFSYILTEKGKARASADVGFILIAYNLKQVCYTSNCQVLRQTPVMGNSSPTATLPMIETLT